MSWLSDAWDSFTDFLGIGIEDEVGDGRANRPADVARVQRVMAATGYDRGDGRAANGILDRSLRDGLRRFQRDQGLRSDGWMRPDGPTHDRLRSEAGKNLDTGYLVRRRSDDARARDRDRRAESSFSAPIRRRVRSRVTAPAGGVPLPDMPVGRPAGDAPRRLNPRP